MATVRADLKNGHRLSNIAAGSNAVRVFYVSGLVGLPEEQLGEAVTTVGIPQLGELYPGAVGLFVQQQNASPGGKNSAKVECVYGTSQGSTFNQPPPVGDGLDVKQFSSSIESAKTITDRAGTPMTISPPAGFSSWGPYLSAADYQVPVHSLVFERSEGDPPTQRSRDMVGSVNEFAVGSYAANSLLFARLDAQSDDGGRVWSCTYEFRYSRDGWKHYDAWRGPTGKVPPGVSGITWDIYPVANFSSLGLDFGDSQTPI